MWVFSRLRSIALIRAYQRTLEISALIVKELLTESAFLKDVVAHESLIHAMGQMTFHVQCCSLDQEWNIFCHQCLSTFVLLLWPVTCPFFLPGKLKQTRWGTRLGHKQASYSFFPKLTLQWTHF